MGPPVAATRLRTAAHQREEQDVAGAIPGAAAPPAQGVDDLLRRPARQVHTIEPEPVKERQRLAVWRPERHGRSLAARDRPGNRRLEGADPEHPVARLIGSAERDLPAVGGQGGRRRKRGSAAVRRQDREPDRRRWSARIGPACCREPDGRCDHDDTRDDRSSDQEATAPRHPSCGFGFVRVPCLLELDADVGDVVEPVLEVPAQAASQDTQHARRRRGGQRGPVGIALENARQRLGQVGACKGAASGEHLVEHAAEGPDVCPLVYGSSARLLGSHVGRGAEEHPHPRCRRSQRQRRGLREVACAAASRLQRFRQTEVEHLHLPSGVTLMFAGLRSR